MLGYSTTVFDNVAVQSDRTTRLDIKMQETVVELAKEVVYVAKRPMISRDMTDSRVTRTADDMKLMPVDNIREVVGLTAGTVDGNFRGGRASEVNFIVDGASMVDPMTGTYEGIFPRWLSRKST